MRLEFRDIPQGHFLRGIFLGLPLLDPVFGYFDCYSRQNTRVRFGVCRKPLGAPKGGQFFCRFHEFLLNFCRLMRIRDLTITVLAAVSRQAPFNKTGFGMKDGLTSVVRPTRVGISCSHQNLLRFCDWVGVTFNSLADSARFLKWKPCTVFHTNLLEFHPKGTSYGAPL